MPAGKRSHSKPRNSAAPSDAGDGLRMRDLTQATGLPRETIHFYLSQGLLPKPVKTGRNTAIYGSEHLEALQRIKELQERHFLPLRAIKAVLVEGASTEFSASQQSVLQKVRESLQLSSAPAGEVALATLVPSRASQKDLEALQRLGLVIVTGKGSTATVSSEDATILECWADLKSLTRRGEPALTPDMLMLYAEAMQALVARETEQTTERFAPLSGKRLAELIEAGVPLVERLLAALHHRSIRAVLRGGGAPSGD